MLLVVAGVARELERVRVAVVELGVPDVLVIDEQQREVAVRGLRDLGLLVREVADLEAALLVEVDAVVVPHEQHDLVAGVVDDVEVDAVVVGVVVVGEEGRRASGEREGGRNQSAEKLHHRPGYRGWLRKAMIDVCAVRTRTGRSGRGLRASPGPSSSWPAA